DSMELVFKQSKAVAVTSMSFPLGDVNNFVVGSEDGSVYMSCRIDCHTAAGPMDFSHLFVTSSFDWTVKLWSTKNNKPLYSFEDNSDYVYDVMWSPTHPALFACVDGVGHLDLWNLNNDTEVPTASVIVEGNPALNRVRWAHTGREIAVGDSDGCVLVYEVGEGVVEMYMKTVEKFVLISTPKVLTFVICSHRSNHRTMNECMQECVTCCALPKCSETFLSENLPEAVDDSAVRRLARPSRHLEPGFDDICRGHQ
ncbi:Cytoplasmic dynein 1 intermediate chain 2, partial [Xenoophorus captivus]